MTPRYVLLSDEEEAELGRFTEASGVFGPEAGLDADDTVRFRQGVLSGHLLAFAEGRTSSRSLGNTWVGLLDREGAVLGRYYLALAEVCTTLRSSTSELPWDVVLTGCFFQPPTPATEPLWKAFAEGSILAPNVWARLSSEGKRAWLEVARLRRSARGQAADAPAGSVFELDATWVEDEVDFLCALGEAINGVGGYFGTGEDSLEDCLAGGFGARPPFVLRWRQEPARAARPASSALDALLRVLLDADVRILGGEHG